MAGSTETKTDNSREFQTLPKTEDEVFGIIEQIQLKNPSKKILIAQFEGIVPTSNELHNALLELDPSLGPGEMRVYSIPRLNLVDPDLAKKMPEQWVTIRPNGEYRLMQSSVSYYIFIPDNSVEKGLIQL